MNGYVWQASLPWPLILALLLVGAWCVWDLAQAVGEIVVERIKAAHR